MRGKTIDTIETIETIDMKVLFFKAEENWLAEEFKRFVPVNVTTSFITLEPALVLAEDKYIRAVLGARLMERLAAYFELDAEERTDGVLNRAIELVQSAELRLAYWDSFDQLAVTITDHGLEDTMGDNRVYRYQADGLRENLQRQGFEQLEQLVEYLEAESSSFPEWEESEACTHKMKSVLPDSKRFFAIVGLKRDFRLFLKLREYITNTERMELPFRLGEQLAKIVTERTEAVGEGSRFEVLYPMVQMFVAFWALADGLPVLQGTVTADGVLQMQESASYSMSGRTNVLAGDKVMEAMQGRFRGSAEYYAGRMVEYLNTHAAEFPEWTVKVPGSESYRVQDRCNRGKRSFHV